MLDPRYCRGQTFEAVHFVSSEAKTLWRRYTDEVLLPTATTLASTLRNRHSADNDDTDNGGTTTTGLCDNSDSDSDSEPDNRELSMKVKSELRMFQKARDLPAFASQEVSPLSWWAAHAKLYPTIAELARIVLAVPGSQIECERIFSLAGLLTSQLRNRMSPENMGSLVFLSRNLDVDATLDELLGPIYGENEWAMSKSSMGSLSESAKCELELLNYSDATVGEGMNYNTIETLLEELEPLVD